uniref:Uncharacterized protein n=1 Tax=Arundo donax TaxID=35708 RepID=A0A0A9CNR5_ARUDO
MTIVSNMRMNIIDLYFLNFHDNRHTASNTVRLDATVTPDQADTFDDELKKLVGMGFEKVLQGFYCSHLSYHSCILSICPGLHLVCTCIWRKGG